MLAHTGMERRKDYSESFTISVAGGERSQLCEVADVKHHRSCRADANDIVQKHEHTYMDHPAAERSGSGNRPRHLLASVEGCHT